MTKKFGNSIKRSDYVMQKTARRALGGQGPCKVLFPERTVWETVPTERVLISYNLIARSGTNRIGKRRSKRIYFYTEIDYDIAR